MFNATTRSSLFVLDQDQVREFYTGTLGFDVVADFDLGFMRWLTVCVPNDPAREILLEKPGPPAMSPDTAEAVGELLSKGAMSGWLSITTDDARGTFETLKGRGVDITDEPSEKPYGIDFGIRDPFGNAIRIGQMFDPAKR